MFRIIRVRCKRANPVVCSFHASVSNALACTKEYTRRVILFIKIIESILHRIVQNFRRLATIKHVIFTLTSNMFVDLRKGFTIFLIFDFIII